MRCVQKPPPRSRPLPRPAIRTSRSAACSGCLVRRTCRLHCRSESHPRCATFSRSRRSKSTSSVSASGRSALHLRSFAPCSTSSARNGRPLHAPTTSSRSGSDPLTSMRLFCLSGSTQPMNSYIFGNAAETETAERFATLDTLYNFRTFRFLETAGIGPGWHCLEVGGGSGSVAAWMAERVGPSGSVLVTDIDPRFMEGSAYRKPAHLELRRHDIGTDPLPEQAFDLIHARLVLMHVPQRREALARLVAALKPRGWLVIEDFDGHVIDRTIPVAEPAAAALFKRVAGALVTLMEERGFEVEWARRLHGRLKTAGLTEVGMEGHVAVSEGGSLGASLDAANFAQVHREAVAKGLVTDAEIDAVLARLNAPDFALFSLVMFTAWGRRPGFAASESDHALPARRRAGGQHPSKDISHDHT